MISDFCIFLISATFAKLFISAEKGGASELYDDIEP